MDKIYVNTDFYVIFNVNEDVSSDTITIERTSPSGVVTTGLSTTSVTSSYIRYDLPRSVNTAVGVWKFQARIVRSGKLYFTKTISIAIHARFT